MNVKALQVGPICTNCYLLEDEARGKAAVIDPGDEPKRIWKQLQSDGMEVEYILLTHGHYDHTTGVPGLLELTGPVPVYIHKADAHGAGNTLFPLSEKVEGLKFYDEGDTLPFGSQTFEVMHTPGHSPGSVVLKIADVLFTGDTLFCGSCGRTDFPGGSYQDIMDSLKRLGELEGDYHVCPGHDRTSTLERERMINPFLEEAMGRYGR